MANVDIDCFAKTAAARAAEFAGAYPFAHVVINNLLDADTSILADFPEADWEGWRGLGDSYQIGKFSCDDIELIPEPYAGIIQQLSTPRFLRALEQLTGIDKLLPDPYLTGGGLHMSCPGGILAPHTDFHLYDKADLYRRINIIVYLCPEWRESDGGCLELFGNADGPHVTVVPGWGNAVIFRTDDRSVHGFPVPVAEGRTRRSIALYYYTAREAETFSGDATTHWREHGEQNGAIRKARFELFRILIKTSRVFSLAAHLVNPNQGPGSLRKRKVGPSGRISE
ncbi:MAG: 2OG-Fe(II) oxygenase [Acidimicrobiales bacterium]